MITSPIVSPHVTKAVMMRAEPSALVMSRQAEGISGSFDWIKKASDLKMAWLIQLSALSSLHGFAHLLIPRQHHCPAASSLACCTLRDIEETLISKRCIPLLPIVACTMQSSPHIMFVTLWLGVLAVTRR